MPEQGQEHFLDNFLRIMHGNAQRECVAEKRVTKLLKKLDDLTLDLRGLRRKRRVSDGWERQPVDRIRWRHRLGSPRMYIPFHPLPFKVFQSARLPLTRLKIKTEQIRQKWNS